MVSKNEALTISSKGNPDDIIVIVKSSWQDWAIVTIVGAVGSLMGGLGVIWFQSYMAGICG